MESSDFGSREVSGKFFQKLSVRWFSPPGGITSARMCATYTPSCAGYTHVRWLSPRGDK